MAQARISRILDSAKNACELEGTRLTRKRQNVLQCLLKSKKPLSAYEIADAYQTAFDEPIRAMSVYRMLDFLIDEKLAHKLKSANKYVACSHIVCDHAHGIPQFLICDKCGKVEEISVSKKIIDSLAASAEKANFTLISEQIELYCLCDKCSSVKRKQA